MASGRILMRRARLGDPDPDLRESTNTAERIALVWVLTLESWELAGRPLPQYSRHETPVRIVPLTVPGMVVQIGLPPRRTDVLTSITGVEFEDAWSRKEHPIDDADIPFIGRRDFITNKRATGRLRDLADIEALGETP